MAHLITLIKLNDGSQLASKETARRHIEDSIARRFKQTFDALDGMKYTDKMLHIEANLPDFQKVMQLYDELAEIETLEGIR